jgi:hypothetical protein
MPVVARRERHPATHGIQCAVFVGGLRQGLVVGGAQGYGHARAGQSTLLRSGARVGRRAGLTAVRDVRQATVRPRIDAPAALGTRRRADHVGEQALASGSDAPGGVGAGVRWRDAGRAAGPRSAPAVAVNGTAACGRLRHVSAGRALPRAGAPVLGLPLGTGRLPSPAQALAVGLTAHDASCANLRLRAPPTELAAQGDLAAARTQVDGQHGRGNGAGDPERECEMTSHVDQLRRLHARWSRLFLRAERSLGCAAPCRTLTGASARASDRPYCTALRTSGQLLLVPGSFAAWKVAEVTVNTVRLASAKAAWLDEHASPPTRRHPST